MRFLTKLFAVLMALALLAAACSESEDPESGAEAGGETPEEGEGEESGDETENGGDDDSESESSEGESSDGDEPTGDSIVEMFAGEEWVYGTVPDAPVEADDSLEPIKIGMVNIENSPVGSYTEIRGAVDAAVNWINAELGGVEGRPIEFIPCITEFSPEKSQACAQEMVTEEVVALVGGIDISSDAAIPVYEQNGLPQLGGIPANLTEQRSPNMFYFSGGTAGGMAAFVDHARENGAESVMIAHGDFESFNVAANDYGAAVAEGLGLEVEVVPFAMIGADFLPILSRAVDNETDAVIMLVSDASCVPVMELFKDLGLAETSQLYMFGACALDEIVQAAGDNIEGVIFNSEGPSEETVEGSIFDEVSVTYTDLPAQATGTVGFRGMMNLYGVLLELGADNITSEAILDYMSTTVDHPSYWGHPYTCDGEQVPGLPALCAPQQTFMTMGADGELELFGDWVDTPALFAEAGIEG